MGEYDGGGWGYVEGGGGWSYDEYGEVLTFPYPSCPFCNGKLYESPRSVICDKEYEYQCNTEKNHLFCYDCYVNFDATTLHVDKLCGMILLPLIEPKVEITTDQQISPEQIYAPDDFKGAIFFTVPMERLNAQIPPWYREVQSRVVYGEPEKPKKKSFFAKLFGAFKDVWNIV